MNCNLLNMFIFLKFTRQEQKRLKFSLSFDDKFVREDISRGIMHITNFQVQHILRSYSRQLADGSRVSKGKPNKNTAQKDEVNISAESKKRLLADKITQELMSQFTNGFELNQTGRDILDRLSQEYGHPLEVSHMDGQGMVFKVSDGENGGTTRLLSTPENEHLKKRLFDMTQSTVYNDLG